LRREIMRRRRLLFSGVLAVVPVLLLSYWRAAASTQQLQRKPDLISDPSDPEPIINLPNVGSLVAPLAAAVPWLVALFLCALWLCAPRCLWCLSLGKRRKPRRSPSSATSLSAICGRWEERLCFVCGVLFLLFVLILGFMWFTNSWHYLVERCHSTPAERQSLMRIATAFRESSLAVAAKQFNDSALAPVWWVDEGALLGSVRNGKLLPHDADLDLNYMAADLGFWLDVVDHVKESDPAITGNTMQLELSDPDVRVDLGRWEPDPHNPGMLRRFLRPHELKKPGARLLLQNTFNATHVVPPLPRCPLEDTWLPCPRNARQLLESRGRYGPGAIGKPVAFKIRCWFEPGAF
jgi:hypothetical protein